MTVLVFTYVLATLLEIALLIEHNAAIKFAFFNQRLVVQIRPTSETRIHVPALVLKCLIP